MRSDCIDAVTRAAGRALTAPEIRNIEGRLRTALRLNRNENPAEVTTKSPAERMQLAADRVARDLQAEASRTARNVAAQIIAHDRIQTYLDAKTKEGMTRTEAVYRTLVNYHDNRTGFKGFEQVYDGVIGEAVGKLAALSDFTSKYAGFWTDAKNLKDLHDEIWGKDSGSPAAKKAAKIWTEQIAEPLRVQRNEVGGNVAKLPGGYDPQVWDQRKAAAVSPYQFMSDMLPLLNRDVYTNADGSPMSDIQMNALLGPIHRTISTDGAANPLGETKGAGGLKNRGTEHRVLHFKDAESARKANELYGRESLMERMRGSIEQSGRQIAAMKTYGPNAEATIKSFLDDSQVRDTAAGHKVGDVQDMRGKIETTFKLASGLMGPQGNPDVAARWQTIRTIEGMTKLGGASIKALGDSKNIIAVNMAHNIPAFRMWAKWESKAWGDESFRKFMTAQGSGIQAVAHGLSRFGEENFGHGVASSWANSFFRATGLNHIDGLRRNAMDASLMSNLGQLTRDHETMDTLHPADAKELKDAGIDGSTWNVWRAARLDPKFKTLCPDQIAQIPDAALKDMGRSPAQLRRDAMQTLVGYTTKATNTVVPMMNLRQRGLVEYKLRSLRGGNLGELARTALMFKSFPIADFSNHWQRILSMPTVKSKVAYASAVYASSLVMGSVIAQLGSLIAGNNPQDMTSPKFYGRALVAGGGIPIYAEMLINAFSTPYKESLSDQQGPIFSTLEQSLKIAQDVRNITGGEKQNLGGDVVRLLRSNAGNVWYAKAALDHLIFQRLQDYYSPGYNQRMTQRTQAFYGSTQWWKPSGAAAPQELLSGKGITSPTVPNLSTATGSH